MYKHCEPSSVTYLPVYQSTVLHAKCLLASWLGKSDASTLESEHLFAKSGSKTASCQQNPYTANEVSVPTLQRGPIGASASSLQQQVSLEPTTRNES